MSAARARRRSPPVSDAPARPILKWAGGKRQLLPELRRFYPAQFDRYIEPFLGSAAVFLDLYNLGRLEGRQAMLADSNADIIGCYRVVRDAAATLVGELAALEAAHRRRGAAFYYEVRDRRFNPARRAAGLAGGNRRRRYPPSLAAMLIYLNRTGYNGLYRLNARGDFNVPAGRYAAPRICDEPNIRRVSAALGRRGVSLVLGAFEGVLAGGGPGDFVYIDPPYAPLSATSRFTSYTAGGFGPDDQVRLRDVVVELATRGCQVLLSNSTAPEIGRLYVEHAPARSAGLQAFEVPARRAINSRARSRGPVMEYLITNVAPETAGAPETGTKGVN